MPPLKQLLEQFAALDPVEREQFAIFLSQEVLPLHPDWPKSDRSVAHPSIVATPNVCGGASRFIRTRIPVWAVERMRQLGSSEIDILRSYPALRAIDLVQAWSYVAGHREEIEREIRENEEG